jgi:hypothetical protein
LPKGDEFEPKKMSGFLQKLQELDAKLFLEGKSPGEAAPRQSLEFYKGKDLLLKLGVGATFTSPEVPANYNPLRYVTSSLTKEVLGVRDPLIQSLTRELPASPKKSENDSMASHPGH